MTAYRDPYSWGGPSYPSYDGMLKGDSTAKKAEENQLQFQEQLMSIFSAQYGKQSQVFNFLQNKLQPMINHPTGYAPAAMSALRAGAADQTGAAFNNAQQSLNQRMLATGGEDQLGSGVNAQLEGGLAAAGAATLSDQQNRITLSNEQLKQQNYWSAMNALNGVGAEYNPQSYASENNQAAGEVGNLSNAYSNSQSAGFFNHFANSFASGLGSTLSGSAQAGAGTTYSGLFH